MSFYPGAAEELPAIRDWLRFAVSRFEESDTFFGHGTHNSYDEAAWLILSALHLPHDTLNNFMDAVLTQPERLHLAGLIERRITERIPTAYLVHEAWLGDFRFYVDERVIVPRSFIAELLREQLAPWVTEPDTIVSAADICTGSGCLAVLLAHAFPNAEIDAVDISPDALEVAERNITQYGLEHRVRLLPSDMLSALHGQQYDLIISNPPYVDYQAMQQLPLEYQHEPELALAGGMDGLAHIHVLLRQAAQHLHPGGLLVLEVGHQRAALEAAYPQLPLQWLETSGGSDFVCLITREALQPGPT